MAGKIRGRGAVDLGGWAAALGDTQTHADLRDC